MENKVISREYVEKIFDKIYQSEIGKNNVTNYMIWSKECGWFINLDFIKKIILNEDEYSLLEEL